MPVRARTELCATPHGRIASMVLGIVDLEVKNARLRRSEIAEALQGIIADFALVNAALVGLPRGDYLLARAETIRTGLGALATRTAEEPWSLYERDLDELKNSLITLQESVETGASGSPAPIVAPHTLFAPLALRPAAT